MLDQLLALVALGRSWPYAIKQQEREMEATQASCITRDKAAKTAYTKIGRFRKRNTGGQWRTMVMEMDSSLICLSQTTLRLIYGNLHNSFVSCTQTKPREETSLRETESGQCGTLPDASEDTSTIHGWVFSGNQRTSSTLTKLIKVPDVWRHTSHGRGAKERVRERAASVLEISIIGA